jgi:osmotically-inducible protein OsmY
MKFPRIFVLCAALMLLNACTPIGLAAGAGASLGIAAAREGGVSGAASDIRIKAMISDKWFKYDVKTFAKLNLAVDQGRVLITGVVQDPESRVEAVRLAWQVEGVKQVINEIRVADSEGAQGYIRDKWISTRLRTAITFDGGVQSINYSIETVQGVVYLMGVAQSRAELDRVIEIAGTIPHVKQVISYVKVPGEPVDGGAPQGTPWLQP